MAQNIIIEFFVFEENCELRMSSSNAAINAFHANAVIAMTHKCDVPIFVSAHKVNLALGHRASIRTIG